MKHVTFKYIVIINVCIYIENPQRKPVKIIILKHNLWMIIIYFFVTLWWLEMIVTLNQYWLYKIIVNWCLFIIITDFFSIYVFI